MASKKKTARPKKPTRRRIVSPPPEPQPRRPQPAFVTNGANANHVPRSAPDTADFTETLRLFTETLRVSFSVAIDALVAQQQRTHAQLLTLEARVCGLEQAPVSEPPEPPEPPEPEVHPVDAETFELGDATL